MISATNQENTIMKSKKQSASTRIIQILNAIIWAVVILICSYLINGEYNQQFVINIIIVAAAIQISLIGYFLNRFLYETHIESQADFSPEING